MQNSIHLAWIVNPLVFILKNIITATAAIFPKLQEMVYIHTTVTITIMTTITQNLRYFKLF